jgi:hypothetical protein
MSLKRLELDFRAAPRATPWLGRALLGVAALVCLDAGMAYREIHQFLSLNEVRVAQRAPRAGSAKVSAQEVAAVRDTVERIGLPWHELFAALESAANDQVALTAIEPDAAKGTVVIGADGKDYLAALSYVANLSRIEGLERVQLVRHEQKGSAVSFAVSAAWGAK